MDGIALLRYAFAPQPPAEGSIVKIGLIFFMSVAMAPAAPRAPSAQFKSLIQKAVGAQLKDSESARYKWLNVQKDDTYCGWVNAKNSFGGYTGFKPFSVYLFKQNGKPLPPAAIIGDDPAMEQAVEKVCSESGYDVSD